MTTATSTSTTKVPRVLWAQRNDIVYVTIEVVEAQEEQVELTKTNLKYSALQGNTGEKYAVELPFYAEIDEVASQENKTDRCIIFTLKKADTEQPYWPRLLKSGKPHYVHTDFSRWKDEDDEEEEGGAASPFGGMDFSQFANMAGGGGFPMGGEDEETADFEDEDEDHEDEDHEHDDEEDPYQKTSKTALESDD